MFALIDAAESYGSDAHRPYSAPAVMASQQPSVSPESETAVLEYLENKGQHQAGAANPRIPRSGLGSRFSVDQARAVRSSAATVEALTAIGNLRSMAADADENGVLVKMSAAELRRESTRRYQQKEAPTTLEVHTDAPHSQRFEVGDRGEGLSIRTDPNTTRLDDAGGAGLFARLSASHKRRLEAKSSEVRAAKSNATILSEQHQHLARRAQAATIMQRAVRQLLVGSRGVRLLALLHLLRTEKNSPRFPLIVGRAVGPHRDAMVTPLLYFLEVALEYEYVLYVENVSRRLVVDSCNKDSMHASPPRRFVRRAILSAAELSELHDTVQERLSKGEVVVSTYQASRGVASLLGPAEECVWNSHVLVDGSTRGEGSAVLSPESFLFSVVRDYTEARRSAPDAVRAPTPAWSCHSGAATQSSSSSASFALQRETIHQSHEATWDSPPTTADIRAKQQQLSAAANRSLDGTDDLSTIVQETPKEWFVGRNASVGLLGSGELTMMPLPASNVGAPANPHTVAVLHSAIESQLAALWEGQDPELVNQERKSKKLARRRVMGAEYKSSSSDEADESAPTGRVAFVEPSMLEFDSAAQRLDRERRERETRRRIEHAVSASVEGGSVPTAAQFDLSSWGLDASSMQQAAAVLGASEATSSSERRVDRTLKDVCKVVVRLGGPSCPTDAGPQECVICEMDAVDVQRCVCRCNWVHRECSFGYDVDAPLCKSAGVKCCRLCGAN